MDIFLKQKSEASAIFKRFRALVEKQMGYYINEMRSNRWGKFKKMPNENGIHISRNIDYSPPI